MAGEIVSPGDAFSQGFEGILMQQAALARQKMLDEIAAKREARLAESDQLDNQIRREQLQQKIAEDKEREAANFVKRYQTSHVAGDIPDAGTLAKAKELGVEDIFREDTSKAVAAPPSETVTLPGAVQPGGPPPPGAAPGAPQTPPVALRLAPSRSEPGLAGPQTYPGSAKEQEMADTRKHAEALLSSLPEGPEKEGLKFWLATGKEPPAGLLVGRAGKVPELGTFGDYLFRISKGHPDELTAAQVESARKKWGEEGRAPQSPINIFTTDENGKLVPVGTAPHGSRILPRHITASDVSKLSPAQQLAFKDIVKRKTDEANSLMNRIFGEGMTDDDQERIFQAAYEEAKRVGATGAPGAPGAAAPKPGPGGVITVHPSQVK